MTSGVSSDPPHEASRRFSNTASPWLLESDTCRFIVSLRPSFEEPQRIVVEYLLKTLLVMVHRLSDGLKH